MTLHSVGGDSGRGGAVDGGRDSKDHSEHNDSSVETDREPVVDVTSSLAASFAMAGPYPCRTGRKPAAGSAEPPAGHELTRSGERSTRTDGTPPTTGTVSTVSTDNPRLRIDSKDGALVVAGEIDAHSCGDLAAALEGVPEGDLDVDLSAVTFIDSSGLRVLVEQHQRQAGAGRSLRIVRPSRSVRRLLEIAGLDNALVIALD